MQLKSGKLQQKTRSWNPQAAPPARFTPQQAADTPTLQKIKQYPYASELKVTPGPRSEPFWENAAQIRKAAAENSKLEPRPPPGQVEREEAGSW
jgi:hypothetical protein